jgi:two-component system LytT family response regulator
MIRAVVVDDEVHAREELSLLLSAIDGVSVVATCADAVAGLQALRRERPDAVFLDVQMPALSGFDLLGLLDPEELPRVVFVTAHDEFAVRAFEANAADYLLKPIEPARLAKTIERLQRGLSPPPAPALIPPVRRVPCLAGKAIKLVDAADVELARSSEGGVYIVTRKGEEFFTDLTLRVLEERVGLLRCHKQHLVNPEAVDQLEPSEEEGATVRTRGGRTVPVSRRFLAGLKTRLGLG